MLDKKQCPEWAGAVEGDDREDLQVKWKVPDNGKWNQLGKRDRTGTVIICIEKWR